MQLVLVGAGSALVLLLLALVCALRVSFDVRALGRADASWVVAFGVETGPFQLAGVLARQSPARLDLRLFGRRLSLHRRARARTKKPRARAPASGKPRRRLPAWIDPVDAALFLLEERRHVQIEQLDLELDYGFRDVALTGKLAGALYVLAGVLPPSVTLRHNPSWEGTETWQAHAEGRVALWPGLVLVEVLWYMIRARLRHRPASPAAEPVRGTAA